MGFDDLHRKRQGNLRKRKSEIKELEPLRFLIVWLIISLLISFPS